MSSRAAVREVEHFVAGEFVGIAESERRNPADPGDVVSLTAVGDAVLVADAVAAAQSAQPGWEGLTLPARGAILFRAAQLLRSRADRVALDLTREEGKTFAEAKGETLRSADILEFFGGEGWRVGGEIHPASVGSMMVYTRPQAIGICGIITPWNFPIAIPTWKIAPALIAGNSVVLKPASLTSTSAWHLARALSDAGLPPGVLNVVYGSGREVGEAIASDPRVGALSFTGSTQVGHHLHDVVSARMARVQLEMGGKNALVVLDDADAEAAAKIAASGGFGLTGQACTATSRVITTPKVRDAFVAALLREATTYVPGNGLDERIRMGPAVDQAQHDRDVEAVARALAEGGELLTPTSSLDAPLFSPAVIGSVKRDDWIAQQEVFGPVIGLLEAGDLDEAIDLVNDSDYGLVAGICTSNIAAAQEFAARAQAGVIKVNRPTTGLELNAPTGGVKASSTNTFREQGATAVDFYTWSKTVYFGY